MATRVLPLAPLCLLLFLPSCTPGGSDLPDVYRTWHVYNGDLGATHYSALDQIDRSNVNQLEVAWTYRSGDQRLNTIECNPIVVDGTMYLTTPALRLVALDAATGTERWSFDPGAGGVNRGVTYWADGDEERIYYAAGATLYALNAATGERIASFGEGGAIDLRAGLDREVSGLYLTSSSPGVIYEDLIILGSALGEGPRTAAPGHIRAFDLHTGERRWIFHTIPHPGEFGYDTWPPDAWQRTGGANSWAGLTLDIERGLVFAPTGSATYDHHGGDRVGQNLFANTVLALDAATGERVWHFQAVHHDLWDYDLASQPTLVTFEKDGVEIDAVAQPTKMGHLFLLDRETGEPVYPVEERPVKASTLEGEASWPTQPFPHAGFVYARQGFTRADVTDRTPEAEAHALAIFEKFGEARLFDPPSEKGDIIVPQFNGGTDWGGASFDPTTGVLYVNASNEPETMTMIRPREGSGHTYPFVADGHIVVQDPDGFPISKPPWGTLNAIDLGRGELLWQVPLGTYPELEMQGLPPTGTFNMGGSVVTAGGLVFIGASMDERFHAYDKETGELLWEYQLPAGGYATPATYEADGRQYVVIAAGGGGKPGTRPGDAYVAFALPRG